MNYMDIIHGENIYENLDVSNHEILYNKSALYDFFNYLTDNVKDNGLIVEVGSYEGASAIIMAHMLKAKQKNAKIICIDTWLGSFSGDKESYDWKSFRRVNGYPNLYYHFLKNVKASGVHDIIIPLPTPSIEGARFLKEKNITADVIYIDASHVLPDVYLDITSYYEFVKSGGVFSGDDYGWPDVKSSIHKFSGENNLDLKIYLHKWIIQK